MRPLIKIIAVLLLTQLAAAFGPGRRHARRIPRGSTQSLGQRGSHASNAGPTRESEESAAPDGEESLSLSFPPPPKSPLRGRTRPRLTVILPAYDEASRIEQTLRTYRSYLEQSPVWGVGNRTDLLVVDDGSTDDTADVVLRLAEELAAAVALEPRGDACVPVRCVSLSRNVGKGGAIWKGVEEVVAAARRRRNEEEGGGGWGDLVLVADADGSGDIACLDDMVEALASIIETNEHDDDDEAFWDRPALVVGDRGYDGAGPARTVLRWGFRMAVRLICGNLGVGDTQCGLKLMTLKAAAALYRDLNLRRWTHDVEVIYRAREMGVPVTERAVRWEDRDGSKLVTSPGGAVGASASMLLEIFRMRVEYAFGRWRIHRK